VPGPSSVGKSVLCRDIVTNVESLMDKPVKHIIWIQSTITSDEEENKAVAASLENQNITYKLFRGYPEQDMASGKIFEDYASESLKVLCLDDVAYESLRSKSLIDLFQQRSHHNNVCIVMTFQDLMHPGFRTQNTSTILLNNSQYVAVFNSRRMFPAVKKMANMYFPGEQHLLLEPFNHMLKHGSPYDYLFINFIAKSDEPSVMKNCLSKEACFFRITPA
jgi:hypothetical protein